MSTNDLSGKTKEDAINCLLRQIYDYRGKTVITRDEIKKIEAYYKNNFRRYDDPEAFEKSDDAVLALIRKLTSGRVEIDKQILSHKALQPGILSECVFMQTLADILDLACFLDLEKRENINKIQSEFSGYIDWNRQGDTRARYIYYNEEDTSRCIVQYGDPRSGDAVAVVYANKISIEIKSMPALVMDVDLIYDEDGHIEYPDRYREEYKEIIDNFNNQGSIFDWMGGNYGLEAGGVNRDVCLNLVKKYLLYGHEDLLVTATEQDELIAVKTMDVNRRFNDGTPLIDTGGSEIRTIGRNARRRPFTPMYLDRILNEVGCKIEGGTCIMPIGNIAEVPGRGRERDVTTRLRIRGPFFVRAEDATNDGKFYKFSKDSIRQSKSGISVHIRINKTKTEIARLLGY